MKRIWHITGFNSYSLEMGVLRLTVTDGNWEVRFKGCSFPHRVGRARYQDEARLDAIQAAKSIADELSLAVKDSYCLI